MTDRRPDHFDLWPATAAPTPPTPPRDAVTTDRLRGTMLGLAIGDSLGNTSEGQIPEDRRLAHGEITDYLPNRYAEGRRVGLPSDDTQLAAWTLESLVQRGCLDPEDLATLFASRQIFGAGGTIKRFLRAHAQAMRDGEQAVWWQLGQPSAGNGALMRIAPVCFPHLGEPGGGLWRDVIDATALTHADEMAVASSVGFVGLLFECLSWRSPESPAPAWWPETFLRYARPVETGVLYEPRVPSDDFQGSLCDHLTQRLLPALADGWTVRRVSDTFYSGAYLLETVPTVLATLALHGSSPEDALVRAVNDAYDNDTVAAVVGAAMGALHGRTGLPARWLDRSRFPGRTQADDDGRLYDLVDAAVARFWEADLPGPVTADDPGGAAA